MFYQLALQIPISIIFNLLPMFWGRKDREGERREGEENGRDREREEGEQESVGSWAALPSW